MTNPEASDPKDLSPVHLAEFRYENRVLRFKPPRYLKPDLDETRQLICLEDREPGIHIFAPTRSELLVQLHEEVEILWAEYAQESDELLTDRAKELKVHLFRNLKEEKAPSGPVESIE
jgi:hypothetical protein